MGYLTAWQHWFTAEHREKGCNTDLIIHKVLSWEGKWNNKPWDSRLNALYRQQKYSDNPRRKINVVMCESPTVFTKQHSKLWSYLWDRDSAKHKSVFTWQIFTLSNWLQLIRQICLPTAWVLLGTNSILCWKCYIRIRIHVVSPPIFSL